MNQFKPINKVYNRVLTLKEFNCLRNKLLIRAKARTKNFNDKGNNYYWKQLEDIENQFPEYKGLGIIEIK